MENIEAEAQEMIVPAASVKRCSCCYKNCWCHDCKRCGAGAPLKVHETRAMIEASLNRLQYLYEKQRTLSKDTEESKNIVEEINALREKVSSLRRELDRTNKG